MALFTDRGKENLGKHRTAEHRANISMALSGKVFTGRRVQVNKWMDNLASAKTFIDTEGRMPNKRAGGKAPWTMDCNIQTKGRRNQQRTRTVDEEGNSARLCLIDNNVEFGSK